MTVNIQSSLTSPAPAAAAGGYMSEQAAADGETPPRGAFSLPSDL